MPFTEDQLMLGQPGIYSVSVSAEQHVEGRDIALGRVHMRQDINVEEDEKCALV